VQLNCTDIAINYQSVNGSKTFDSQLQCIPTVVTFKRHLKTELIQLSYAHSDSDIALSVCIFKYSLFY